MKVHTCKQGSREWLQLRAGIPTSSQFDRIVTPTGKPSSQAEAYMFTLLAERILGRPIVEHMSQAMERGSHLERKAVEYFEFLTDVSTEEVGFLTDDDERWGTSPDRVFKDGFIEIKCPEAKRHMMNLLAPESAKREYFVQTQGQLWIGEGQRTSLLSYHPELPYALLTIERDKDFIQKLETEVRAFSDKLETLAAVAMDLGYFREGSVHRPKESLQDAQVRILKESLASRNSER